MPSSLESRKFGSEPLTKGFTNSTMWSYGMMPWQQPVPPQQYAYPMPFPVVMPQINTQPWFPTMENFTSLPPKSKQDNENTLVFETVKPTRRFSDPGPVGNVVQGKAAAKSPSINKAYAQVPPPVEDEWEYPEPQLYAEEARKDRLFSNLLQELRSARQLNRQLCLELHKAKMQLQLIQQQTNEHQPGSIAALVRKLYEAHHIRSDIISNWNKSEDSFGRRSSYSSTRFDSDEPENSLMKEREILINRLQSTEKKIQYFRNAQWNGVSNNAYFHKQPTEMRPTMTNSRCTGDVLSSSKVSRSHSFAMTSPSTSDPPSLDDVDLASSKIHGGMTGSGNAVLSSLLLQPGRPHLDGRTYSSSNSSAVAQAVASTAIGEATLKRDLELQLATVERDRRQLEHQLVETIGTRRHSEDRVIKLERLVSVLRKKLEEQTSTSITSSTNGLGVPPSPTESSGTATASTPTAGPDYAATYPQFGWPNQMLTDGPASLPSYLQVVGPITQL